MPEFKCGYNARREKSRNFRISNNKPIVRTSLDFGNSTSMERNINKN